MPRRALLLKVVLPVTFIKGNASDALSQARVRLSTSYITAMPRGERNQHSLVQSSGLERGTPTIVTN